jgi:glutamyl-tRNA synthetase
LRKHLKDDAIAPALAALSDAWRALPDWRADALEASLRALAEARGLKAAQLIHPVRLAVTGRTASPGLFEVVALLGVETTLDRMRRLLDRVSAGLV